LHLWKPRSLPIDVLPAGFSVLRCSVSSQDGLFFLSEPLNFLLDFCQLFLLYCCIFFLGFFAPINNLDLIELCIS
jgi:hypothetical protein